MRRLDQSDRSQADVELLDAQGLWCPVARDVDAAVAQGSYYAPRMWILLLLSCSSGPSCEAPATWYVDADGDGWGLASGTTEACEMPAGYAPRPGDCDDRDADRVPDGLWEDDFIALDAEQSLELCAACVNAVEGNLIGLSGAEAFSCIEQVGGNVVIDDSVRGLEQLRSVGGTLNLTRVEDLSPLAQLENLDGLRLTAVGDASPLANAIGTELGELTILGDDVDLGFLAGLERVRDSVRLSGTPTGLDGLSGLESIGGPLEVYESAITDWSGLSRLTSVGGLSFEDNNGLSLDGFPATEVSGSLVVFRNAGLVDLTGLEDVVVQGGVIVSDNPDLERLTGLGSGIVALEDLSIENNPSLVAIDGLSGLQSVTLLLAVRNNPSLSSLEGLQSLAFVGGLQISAGTRSLDGLSALTAIGEAGLEVSFSPTITSLDGLEALTAVDGPVWVQACPDLQSVSLPSLERAMLLQILDLPAAQSVSLPAFQQGDVFVQDLPGVTELALPSLEQASWLVLSNMGLVDLSGLSALVSSGDLSIDNQPGLTSLDGLEGLRTVDGDLDVQANAALTDVTALHTVESVSNVLRVRFNVALPQADAEAMLEAIGPENVGLAIVEDNGP